MAIDKTYNFTFFMKIWIPMTITVVAAVFSAQAWMGEQYYSKTASAALEHRIEVVEMKQSKVAEQNDIIIEKLGFIMGKLSIEEQ
jgi:ABC-type protease/lipase transport system fused ATPase/permease subunit